MFRAADDESDFDVTASEDESDKEIRNVDYAQFEKDKDKKPEKPEKPAKPEKRKSEKPDDTIEKQEIPENVSLEEEMYGEMDEEFEEIFSMHSACTSIDSEYKLKDHVDSDYNPEQPIITKLVQKYQRESEMEVKKEKPRFKRGTMLSHSTTKVRAKPLCFYFGVVNGTLHQGDETFSEKSRNNQGFANAVAAYAFSFTKPPACWTKIDIDKVLEIGEKHYLESVKDSHIDDRPLKPKEMNNVITLGDLKIHYIIHEPDVAGVTESKDPKIFDLLKGLILFFGRYRAGILTTLNISLLIWKRKRNYYVFDPRARDMNLYIDEEGTALLANFYDLQSVMVMLVDRGDIVNSPFIISRISLKKVVEKDEDLKDEGDSIPLKKESQYKIVSPHKACLLGTFHVGDKSFIASNKKQILCVIVTALFYRHITPAAAWHSKTLDKILTIGNQFFLECMKEMTSPDFKLQNLPAFFTIGPITVELVIYENQSAGLMFKKGLCFFEHMLKKFFQKHTSAILEIDKYVLGMWKQRNFYYMFDPYCRNNDGLKCEEGGACISMNGVLKSLVDTVLHNFENKEYIFKIHALKVVKLNKDPEYSNKMPGTIDSELLLAEEIRVGNKKALKNTKPVRVDRTEQAVRSVSAADVSLGASIIEISSDVSSIEKTLFRDLPTERMSGVKPTAYTPAEVVYDLDSPSLSDTQIEQTKPDPDKSLIMKISEEITEEELIDYEEMEEHESEEETEEISLAHLRKSSKIIGITLTDEDQAKQEQTEAESEMEGEMRDVQIQKGKDLGLATATAEINTDLMGLSPLPRIVLEPTNMAQVILARRRARRFAPPYKKISDLLEKPLTQSEEFERKCNFKTLPDGSHIVYGSINITDFDPELHEDASPYVSIMAIAMARKYSLHTWNADVVDFVVRCGYELHRALKVDFAAFYTIEVPQVAVGSTVFHILAEHLFDSLLEPIILEEALAKILFQKFCMGVIACKIYSCAVFLKNGVYYMFDGYGCNLVGLGEGPENNGVACIFRFRNLNRLVNRFMHNKKQREVIEPTIATRFIISQVKVTSVFEAPPEPIKCPSRVLEDDGMYGEGEEDEKKKEVKPINILGYTKKGKYVTIQGTMGLEFRFDVTGCVKICHFISICTILGLLCKPIRHWHTKRVNYVFETGANLFPFIDNTSFADKRSIRNLLIDKFFFDVVVKRINIQNPVNSRNFMVGLQFVLAKKHKYILIQFPNCCFVLYKTKCFYHLFDPYGIYTGKDDLKKEQKQKDENVEDENAGGGDKEHEYEKGKACWIRFTTLWQVKKYIHNNTINENENFFFFTVSVSSIKKASRWRRLEYKLRAEKIKRKRKVKQIKILHESEDWLDVFPIPWSRMTKNLASGEMRGLTSQKWNHWDIEYPNDLYSLTGTIHQASKGFSRTTRGKQTIANCIVAVIMTQIYSLNTWNSSVLNSILRAGDKYFQMCIKNIKDENYELRLEDFKKSLIVEPYTASIDYVPSVEGTMFVIKSRQFNLSKALRFFFEQYDCRHGIICCTREGAKPKFLTFGKLSPGEYYMFDCQTIGPYMFMDKYRSAAYILRCLSLNRLLYVMTVTLRGGDFFIYTINILGPGKDLDEKEMKLTDYGEENEEEGKHNTDASGTEGGEEE